jgi:succinate-acetate transporter protein
MLEEKKLIIGDPTALGLISYGIALICLSMMVGGFMGKPSFLIMSIVFIGAVGIGIAGIFDFLRGNTFGAVAFVGWGLFFGAFAQLNMGPTFKTAMFHAGPALVFLGWYFIFWAVFGLLTVVGSFVAKKWVMLRIALILTTLMLVFAAIAHWLGVSGPDPQFMRIAAICGILAALCSMYTAFAAFLNEIAGKTVLPA